MAKEPVTASHVHLGAGAFGLGFVIPLVQQAGLKSSLANRAKGSATHHACNVAIQRHGSYDLVLKGKQTRTEIVPIEEFVFVDVDTERFLEVVANPKTRLLTTALRQGFLPSVPLLADAVANRLVAGTKEVLYVVACETPTIGDSLTLRAAVLATHPELAQREFDQRIKFVPCIVDRICNEPELDEATDRVMVEAEEFAEWLLQGPSSLEDMLRISSVVHSVSFVPDLAPFVRRKLWLVNGPHLLIALRAFVQPEPRLDKFLARDENRRLLSTIHREALNAFLEVESFFSRRELTRYAKIIQTRFSNFPDSTTRHLPRLAQRRMAEFMADFYKKAGVLQIPHATRKRRVAYQTALTLLLATELVAHGRYAYDDAGQPIPVD